MKHKSNKNGFVFMETIIAIVILMASFMILINMYMKLINKINDRIDYDNVTNIYKAYNFKKALVSYSDFKNVYSSLVNNNKKIINIGVNTSGLTFNDKNRYLKVLNELDINNIYLIYDIEEYKKSCLYNYDKDECSYIYLSDTFGRYIDNIKEDIKYLIIIETGVSKSNESDYVKYTYLDLKFN